MPADARARILHELETRDFVGLEREVEGLRLGDGGDRGAAAACRSGAAGPRCSTTSGDAAAGLRAVYAALPAPVAGRVIFDLGLARGLDYYTGAVFEVYDAALGAPLGGGGRYDELLGRFGRDAAGRGLGAQRRAASTSRSSASGAGSSSSERA